MILTVLLLLFWLTPSGFAQAPPKAGVPSAYQGSTAVGSYPLSGFDNINYFNGNLDFNLPLITLGGRGEASFTMMLTIGQAGWRIDTRRDLLTCNPGNCLYRYWYNPTNALPEGLIKAGLGPGKLQATHTGRYSQTSCPGSQPAFSERLTTIAFAMPGGSAVELRDAVYEGKPLPASPCGPSNGPSRGTVFKSFDGSAMTFVSDTPLEDKWAARFAPVSGNLYMKNGVRYRVDNGNVSRITDRNGNWITFQYNVDANTSMIATDSIGREVRQGSAGITFSGINGIIRTIRIYGGSGTDILRSDYQPLTHTQAFPELVGKTDYTGEVAINGISKLELPDGRNYEFKYNPYNELARVELPTGGAYEYDWTGSAFATRTSFDTLYDDPQTYYGYIFRNVIQRRVYEDGATGENYTTKTTISGLANGSNSAKTVNEYAGGIPNAISRTDHFFYGIPNQSINSWNPYYNEGWNVGREYQTDVYAGDGTQLLRRQQQTYQQRAPVSWYCQWNQYCSPALEPQNDPRLVETVTTLADSNQVSKTSAINPNTGVVGFDQYNNQTDVYEYDYGTGAAGAFKRRTHTDYVTDTNYTAYTGVHLRGLPLQSWVSSDTSGSTKASLMQYEYDNYAGGSNAALMSRVNIVGHDTTNYGTNYTQRGNVTKVTTYGNAQTQTEPISAYSNYDILGNIVKTIDAKGYISTIDYTDRFGAPDSEARANTSPTELGALSTFAFPTSSTNALGWTTGYVQFDYYTGQTVDAEDINGVVSSTFYEDALDRPTQTIAANNLTNFRQKSWIIYDDANRRVETHTDLFVFGDGKAKSESFYDGLGRTIESRGYEADGNYIATKSIPLVMVQDPETQIWRAATKVSNPYRPNAGEPPIWTTSLSDSLGRGIKVITPDGAFMKTEYSGNAVTVTDASGRQGRSITNGLGQLTRVDEPDSTGNLGTISSPTQPTSYKYDTAGMMVEVTQGGQKRNFLYDNLGRLLRVRQPEQTVNASLNLTDAVTGNSQWTAGFTYDNLGNVLTATDAKGITITNTYDILSRVLTRSFSDGTTPPVSYLYDDSNVPYSKGKLTKVSNSVSISQTTAFDILGRALTYQQITDGQTYTSSYQYNLSGALVQETYPSGRVVQNEFESDGDLARIFGKANATATEKIYANGFSYTADGKIQRLRLGNGRWESAKFNSRLQVTELALGSSNGDGGLWKLAYEYGELNTDGVTVNTAKNTGNIAKQTVSFNGLAQPFVQTYKYDSLYRLTEARETSNSNQTWKQTFGYDRFGNRTTYQKFVGQTQIALDNKTFPQIDAATNRFLTTQGYGYDQNGNLTLDAENRQFTFNGDNKQTKVELSGTKVGEYFYDGEGKRVKKKVYDSDGGLIEETIFVYSAGKLIAEYSTAPPPSNPTTSYTATDQLGSPRVIINAFGQVTSRRDFQPFGEELLPDATYRTTNLKYGANDSVRQRFTGYLKDVETGLDFAEARMYENRHGRFTAIDPLLASGKSINPQTFNRYAYTMNRPLILTDKSGLQAGSDENEIIARIYTIWDNIKNTFYEARKERTDYLFNGLSNSDPLQNANGGRLQRALDGYQEGPPSRLIGPLGPTVDSVLQQTNDSVEAMQTTAEYGFLAQNLVLGAAGMVGPGSANITTNRGFAVSGNESSGNRLFSNLFPQDTPRSIPIRELSFDGNKWRATGLSGATITPNGKYNFVVQNDNIFITRPKLGGLGGHVDLSRGNPVQFAGEIRFGHGNNAGNLRIWNNASGHFQPPASSSNQAPLPQNLFRPHPFF